MQILLGLFGRFLLCCVWIGLEWIQFLGHQLDWTGLGSMNRGFGLDWILATQSIPYSGRHPPAQFPGRTRLTACHLHRSTAEQIRVDDRHPQLVTSAPLCIWFGLVRIRPFRSEHSRANTRRRPPCPQLATSAPLDDVLGPANEGVKEDWG